jgi:hypothetical protein
VWHQKTPAAIEFGTKKEQGHAVSSADQAFDPPPRKLFAGVSSWGKISCLWQGPECAYIMQYLKLPS